MLDYLVHTRIRMSLQQNKTLGHQLACDLIYVFCKVVQAQVRTYDVVNLNMVRQVLVPVHLLLLYTLRWTAVNLVHETRHVRQVDHVNAYMFFLLSEVKVVKVI